jgi:hypothetical protein
MLLEPVYVLAPAPQRRPPTRRAFLGAGIAGIVGAGTGFGLARWLAQAEPVESPAIDRNLAWARALADGDARELWRHWDGFVAVLITRAPDDPVLWRGVARLADTALEGSVTSEQVDRARVARALASLLGAKNPPPTLRDAELRRALESIGRER